jgi:hypothetical protein
MDKRKGPYFLGPKRPHSNLIQAGPATLLDNLVQDIHGTLVLYTLIHGMISRFPLHPNFGHDVRISDDLMQPNVMEMMEQKFKI